MSLDTRVMNRTSIVRRAAIARLSRVVRMCVCAVVVVGLSACFSGPPPARFLLEPAFVPSAATNEAQLSYIGLITVSVPDYVKETSIAYRGEGPRLRVDENGQWAEAPEGALTRILAESLRMRSGAEVLIEPLPRGFEPDVRVEVDFSTLLAEASGGADMAGQVRLISGDGRSLMSVQSFRMLQRAPGGGREGFFYAVSIGVDELSRMIVDSLTETPG